ncbi:hypothetical protein ACOSQ3_029044 [Xanthoceras sorbifolium]
MDCRHCASDHMTSDPSLLTNFRPCNEGFTVRIADRTASKVIGTGCVKILDSITLNSVLLVPNFDCNLLSIHKLTKDQNCMTKFSHDLCEFQVLGLEKMIDSAKMCSRLYLLKIEGTLTTQALQVMLRDTNTTMSSSSNNSEIMLYHYRLGHPNFLYLEKLYPSLFKNKNPESLQCEICQFSKHVRNSYHNTPYKTSHPFSMI